MERLVKKWEYLLQLKNDFRKLGKTDQVDKWGIIRQIYIENLPDIISTAEENKHHWAGVYNLDWPSYFSPIELKAWHSIRDYGDVVLYPQFPLFNSFIDFANPYLRIGLELDGKKFHNKEEDQKRDELFFKLNWSIFRVTGEEMNSSLLNLEELEERGITGKEKHEAILNWLNHSGDGIVWAIKQWYFSDIHTHEQFLISHDVNFNDAKFDIYLDIYHTLSKHCYTEIPRPNRLRFSMIKPGTTRKVPENYNPLLWKN